ncbi:MAG TPA: hypothetical protein H9693_04435 [Firmicutes bacterium]|nr:hypothetical protein [Bacillota bacterium]
MNYGMSRLLSEAAAEGEFVFPFTMVITVAISLALIIVLIFLLVPRKKYSPVAIAADRAEKCVEAALAFAANTCDENFKKLRRAAKASHSALVAAVYKGLVELQGAQDLQNETVKVMDCLRVSRADAAGRAEFAAIVLDNALHVAKLVRPFVDDSVDDGPLALGTRTGANAYLDSVRRRHQPERAAKEIKEEEDSEKPTKS